MMIGPEYGVQALAWAVLWSIGGVAARQWLAKREGDRRRDHSR